jgi:hypothetical protein
MNRFDRLKQRARVLWHRFRKAARNAWRPPCAGCGAPATHCEGCAKAKRTLFIALDSSRFCLDCQGFFAAVGPTCPNCGSRHSWILGTDLLGRDYRRQRASARLDRLKARHA